VQSVASRVGSQCLNLHSLCLASIGKFKGQLQNNPSFTSLIVVLFDFVHGA